MRTFGYIVLVVLLLAVVWYVFLRKPSVIANTTAPTGPSTNANPAGPMVVIDNNAVNRTLQDDSLTSYEKGLLNQLTRTLNGIRYLDISDSQKLQMYRQAVSNTQAQGITITESLPNSIQTCDCQKGAAGLCWQWNGVIFVVSVCRRKCCDQNIVSNLTNNTMF